MKAIKKPTVLFRNQIDLKYLKLYSSTLFSDLNLAATSPAGIQKIYA